MDDLTMAAGYALLRGKKMLGPGRNTPSAGDVVAQWRRTEGAGGAQGVRPRFGRVVIQIEKEFNDELKVGDTTLYLDPSYKPLHHVQEFGTVVAIPLEMADWNVSECEVVPGDRVRFHFHSVATINLVVLDQRNYYAIPYEQLYYVEQPDGTPRMLNDYCLVEPVLTAGGEEKTASGLITNLDAAGHRRPVANYGVLHYLPPARPQQPHQIPTGATIAYVNDADLPLEVGNQTFYLMDYRREILGVVQNFVATTNE